MAKILIVDDEHQICRLLSQMLAVKGEHHTEVATTFQEALAIAEQFLPDLLIVDWMLGDAIDGLELTACIRTQQPALPMILMTGFVSDNVQSQIQGLARSWVLPKPCRLDDLLSLVELALSSPLEGKVEAATEDP